MWKLIKSRKLPQEQEQEQEEEKDFFETEEFFKHNYHKDPNNPWNKKPFFWDKATPYVAELRYKIWTKDTKPMFISFEASYDSLLVWRHSSVETWNYAGSRWGMDGFRGDEVTPSQLHNLMKAAGWLSRTLERNISIVRNSSQYREHAEILVRCSDGEQHEFPLWSWTKCPAECHGAMLQLLHDLMDDVEWRLSYNEQCEHT